MSSLTNDLELLGGSLVPPTISTQTTSEISDRSNLLASCLSVIFTIIIMVIYKYSKIPQEDENCNKKNIKRYNKKIYWSLVIIWFLIIMCICCMYGKIPGLKMPNILLKISTQWMQSQCRNPVLIVSSMFMTLILILCLIGKIKLNF